MIPRVLFCAIMLSAITPFAPLASAGTCSYGSVYAWFQGSNGHWVNATAHTVLKPGEVFHLQVRVTLSSECQAFFLKLHEFGTPVYEVLAGPTQMEELFEYRGEIKVQYPYIYEWTIRVRPTTSWTCGSAPLEVFAQLNKDDSKDCTIDFDALVALILPNYQTSSEAQQVSENHSSAVHPRYPLPGFQDGLVSMAIVVLCLLLRLKQHR